MSRWFRFYNETLNDPKILRMPEALRWNWVAMLSVASINGGTLPHVEDIALHMRKTVEDVEELLSDLVARELIDEVGDGLFAPHNWKNRQYKSDVSTERVKRFRNVSVTPPDTETDSKPRGLDAAAPPHVRLWSEGVPALMALGLSEKQIRPMIGRWLKDCGDDHTLLLGLILRARDACPANPIPWITQSLKTHGKPNAKTGNVIAAADRLVERLADFRKPAPSELRGGEGATVIRAIPERRSE